jgi:hypothetical protein
MADDVDKLVRELARAPLEPIEGPLASAARRRTVHAREGSAGVAGKLTRAPMTRLARKPAVSAPGDAHEREADRAASAMVEGRSFAVGESVGATIARSPTDLQLDAPGELHLPRHAPLSLFPRRQHHARVPSRITVRRKDAGPAHESGGGSGAPAPASGGGSGAPAHEGGGGSGAHGSSAHESGAHESGAHESSAHDGGAHVEAGAGASGSSHWSVPTGPVAPAARRDPTVPLFSGSLQVYGEIADACVLGDGSLGSLCDPHLELQASLTQGDDAFEIDVEASTHVLSADIVRELLRFHLDVQAHAGSTTDGHATGGAGGSADVEWTPGSHVSVSFSAAADYSATDGSASEVGIDLGLTFEVHSD